MDLLTLQTLLPRFMENIRDFGFFTTWAFYAVVVGWLVFSVILLYHWLRYNLHAFFTFPSLVIYTVVSLAIIGYASGGIV